MQKLQLTNRQLKFISDFSNAGISDSKKYFQYDDDGLGFEINIFAECPEICRVSKRNDVIQFNTNIFTYSPDTRKWMLLWAFSRNQTNQDSKSDIMATEAMFDYGLTKQLNGRFKAEMLQIFSSNPTHINQQRLLNIFETIKRKTNETGNQNYV